MEDRNTPLTASDAGKQWQTIGVRHHHGINLALFSLRSKQSAGIGEYFDLLPMIDFCVASYLSIIQLLPLNDTGVDKSPYNALSAFALNPIHISLAALPHLEAHPDLQAKLADLQKLNSIDPIPFDQVRILKDEFLRSYWEKEFFHFEKSADYENFLEKNSYWIKQYSLFRVLKDKFQGSYWKFWADPFKTYSEELYNQESKACTFYSFIQYLCYLQFKQVEDYAFSKKILLMGDLPILISPDSADVWANPELFDNAYSAGAPPDMYSAEGQSWGFPLYNWQTMERLNYKWWQERLKSASSYYQLFRIDHVVGFFRIWAILPGQKAKDGHFIPENPEQRIPQGRKIMQIMLQATNMLPIGEDLGVVPPEVRACLRDLGICGTKVMRWERVWNEDSRFIPINEYIPESLTTVSTHDSSTLSLWWKESPEEVKRFCSFKGWEYHEDITHDQLFQILYDSHHSTSLFHINLLHEYLALFPGLVNPDPAKERVNLPGIMNAQNWCYRLRPSVEEIVSNKDLQATMQALIR